MAKPLERGNRKVALDIRATLAEVPEQRRPDMAAYVYSRGGALLGTG